MTKDANNYDHRRPFFDFTEVFFNHRIAIVLLEATGSISSSPNVEPIETKSGINALKIFFVHPKPSFKFSVIRSARFVEQYRSPSRYETCSAM